MSDKKLTGTFGLVACGGSSSRMGTDKSMLIYHNKPQRYHLYEMLQPFCDDVLISCKEEQVVAEDEGFHILTDDILYNNIGPMAALLTAFSRFPQTNMLLIGCDYPFLTNEELHEFARHCDKSKAAAFYNEKEDIYEPLLAWYSCNSFAALKEMHREGKYSLQHFLRNNEAIKCHPRNFNSMVSVDTAAARTGIEGTRSRIRDNS
jgi:molybdenum cofactor guanylyltransferase